MDYMWKSGPVKTKYEDTPFRVGTEGKQVRLSIGPEGEELIHMLLDPDAALRLSSRLKDAVVMLVKHNVDKAGE